MPTKLIPVGFSSNVQEIILSLPAVIGRGREAAVNVRHPQVSRQHCKLFKRDGSLFVQDLESCNGTFVGAERLPAGGECEISSGELLTIGQAAFRVEYSPADMDSDESTTDQVVSEVAMDGADASPEADSDVPETPNNIRNTAGTDKDTQSGGSRFSDLIDEASDLLPPRAHDSDDDLPTHS